MGRGKEGDPRRRNKGGRYTPPTRRSNPDANARLQDAVYAALTAKKQDRTEANSPHVGVPPLEQLPPEDQAFLRGLSTKVRTGESTTSEGQSAREHAFHEAVSEVNDYILALRARLDVGFKEPHPSDTGNTWARAEPSRPSVKRVQNVAYNFFELPGIRKQSINIHVQKIAAALPHFREMIACSTPTARDLREYLSNVTTLMADSIVLGLETDKLEEYRKVGGIMGYRTAGMRWPIDPALRHFAGQGVETFVEQLGRVIRGAIDDRVDVSERVRAELLEKEGTIYRLMRISFDRVNDAVKDIEGKSIEDARKVLAGKEYSTGACPAVAPIDSVIDAEAKTKRPIAYEYAIPIVRHIPPRLLQPA